MHKTDENILKHSLDECKGNPCVGVKCKNTVGSYKCICPGGNVEDEPSGTVGVKMLFFKNFIEKCLPF